MVRLARAGDAGWIAKERINGIRKYFFCHDGKDEIYQPLGIDAQFL